MDLTAHLTETWTAITELLSGLDDARWRSAKPCEGWTVHDVAAHLGHMEGLPLGFDQPEPPDEFDPASHSGIDAVTEAGVAARRSWSHAHVLDEIRRASAGTLDRVSHLDAEEWETERWASPIGVLPMHQAQEIRLADAYVHLLDMRHGLGMPLDPTEEPLTAEVVVGRAVRLTGWGAVKGARLPDGTHIRLDIEGAGGTSSDLVVEGGRGNLGPPHGETTDRIAGTGLAYLLAVAGRRAMVDAAGGLDVSGDAAAALLGGYRLFL